MIDEKKLQEWRALAEKATPGPWVLEGSGNIPDIHYWDNYEPASTDELFIAAARTAVPALLDEVERLRAEKAAMPSDWTEVREQSDALLTVCAERDALRAKYAPLTEALERLRSTSDTSDTFAGCIREVLAVLDAYELIRPKDGPK